MAMLSSEELLEQAAANGTFDAAEWPRVLETVLARLEQNVFKEFPIPQPPQRQARETSLTTSGSARQASRGPDTSREEDEPPSSPPAAPSTPEPRLPPSTRARPNGPSNESEDAESSESLPRPLLRSYEYIVNALKTSFETRPPHTVQRLAELVLYPRQHYRYVPSYLNALDRTVSVSSASSIFPLPSLDPLSAASRAAETSNGVIVNGDLPASHGQSPTLLVASHAVSNLDDDSLGGALLTPIPWLRVNGGGRGRSVSTSAASGGERSSSPYEGDVDADASASSPSSALSGSSSSREPGSNSPTHTALGEDINATNTGAVTQGELLRQEQAEGEPPAPVSSLPSRAHLAEASAEELLDIDSRRQVGDVGIPLHGDGVEDDPGRETFYEQPHARGPDLIGFEDAGRQDVPAHGPGGGQLLDIEAAVGRASSKTEKMAKDSQADTTRQASDETKTSKRKAGDDDESDGASSQKLRRDGDGDVELADVDGNQADDIAPAPGEGLDAEGKAT